MSGIDDLMKAVNEMSEEQVRDLLDSPPVKALVDAYVQKRIDVAIEAALASALERGWRPVDDLLASKGGSR